MAPNLLETQDVAFITVVSGKAGVGRSTLAVTRARLHAAGYLRAKRSADLGIRHFAVKLSR
jgi:MinD-like ATPase involved in chromosome partitioning or flagellar assembly